MAAVKTKPECIAEECSRISVCRELCSIHYGRLRRHGYVSTDADKKKPAERFVWLVIITLHLKKKYQRV